MNPADAPRPYGADGPTCSWCPDLATAEVEVIPSRKLSGIGRIEPAVKAPACEHHRRRIERRMENERSDRDRRARAHAKRRKAQKQAVVL